jgi:uncharacterized protein YyaL (SSP411 family)
MTSASPAPANRLALETSPYLRQHANNPVDWFPWGSEALEIARRENRPILLSIGYSACHWCHVMAHESFEDEATAELMNENFINIKVDREERPDLDRIYQLAHQLLTRRSGGWPLTVFLTPDDQRPFFAGTYFPDKPRNGMSSFGELLPRVADFFHSRTDDIHDQCERLVEAMATMEPSSVVSGTLLNDSPLTAIREQLATTFDQREGGFGKAPKFPHPTNLERLFRHHARTGRHGKADGEALAMALFTLAKMGNGGLYDQLGGGFYRYSTDDAWLIPHFEKMLYDNAPLMHLCIDAWQLTAHDDFRRWAEETADWAVREMHIDGGGFASALDADSEGEEGLFYLWEPDQIKQTLSAEEFEVMSTRYGLDQPANFEEWAWHLHVRARIDELGIAEIEAKALEQSARLKLRTLRESERVLPGRDDKMLTSWNAMMISAMARTGAALGRDDLIDCAHGALDAIGERLWKDGRLLASYKDGDAHLMAYLDDHAQLIEAIIASLQARWRDGLIDWAVEVAELMIKRFVDTDKGGFFFTADDHETLIHRSRPFMDDAMPAGNAVAVRALARLGSLLGETRYLEVAEHTLRAGWLGMERIPHGHAAMINALEEWLDACETVVIRGPAKSLEPWRARATACYSPTRQVFAIPDDAVLPDGLLTTREAVEGAVVAYVCDGFQCQMPVNTLEEFEVSLKPRERPRPTRAS